MRSRDIPTPGASRGRFPRPNLTMRELIGLVLAFALSNAFLSWSNPMAAHDTVTFAIWNGLLSLYLGFAFIQAWVRSGFRWMRTGHADRPARRPRRWTALGVAEATVIGGTMFYCTIALLENPRGMFFEGDRWVVPTAILLIGSAGGLLVLRMMRSARGASLTGRGAGSTIEVVPGIGNGETR